MSKDVIRPLLKSVADMPEHHTGLDLSAINAQRGQNAQKLAERLKQAFVPSVQKVGEISIVTLTASVNRTLALKQALLVTGRKLYLNEDVVANWPASATGDTVTMSLYNFGRYIEVAKLDEELAKVGLELETDLVGLAAINQAYPELADDHLNGTQRKSADGKFCYAIFSHWYGERDVSVDQGDVDWHDGWWFPVRCKQAA